MSGWGVHQHCITRLSFHLLTFSLSLCDWTCAEDLWGFLKRPLTKNKRQDLRHLGGFSSKSSLYQAIQHLPAAAAAAPSSPFGHPESPVLCCPFLSPALPKVYNHSCCLPFTWQLFFQVHVPGQCIYGWSLMSFRPLTRVRVRPFLLLYMLLRLRRRNCDKEFINQVQQITDYMQNISLCFGILPFLMRDMCA